MADDESSIGESGQSTKEAASDESRLGADGQGDADEAAGNRGVCLRGWSPMRLALAFLVTMIAALGGLAGWVGYQANGEHRNQQERQMLLQAGRQTALNLTTIDYTDVDSNVERVLESATGTFHDEFQSNAAAFAKAVRMSKSKTVGSVTEAGIESIDGNTAQILVTAAVKTTNVSGAEQQPRLWRMRITVEKSDDGDEAKVSNVGFVP